MTESISEIFSTLMDSEKLIAYGGLTLLLIVVFAETGLFFGFFLPGDYLLFTAGLLCGTELLDVNIYMLTGSVIAAAIAGDYTGYASGRLFGKKLFKKEDSFFFKQKYLHKTEKFFTKYGNASLILGRYFPIVRTFAPILAGAVKMDFKKFSIANISGGILWVSTLIPTGYYLGKTYPQVMEYLGYIIAGFIIVTTLPFIKLFYENFKSKHVKTV